MHKKSLWLVLTLLVLGIVLGYRLFSQPVGRLSNVMLTWNREDTSRTALILYQTTDSPTVSKIFYDTVRRNGVMAQYRHQQIGQSERFEPAKRTLHWVELTHLIPKTNYYFSVGDESGLRGREFVFRTLPADDSPIRIVTGGDMDITDTAKTVSLLAAKMDPDLVVIGGDLAYANGKLRKSYIWDEWLRNWTDIMVTSDGRLIPIIAAIGNHEVNREEHDTLVDKAPFYTRYLRQDDANLSYFSRKIGANLGLLVLDTDHLHPPSGAQRAWLEDQLKKYQSLAFRIAVYHRPLYPGGHYPGVVPGPETDLVDQWLDLFDRYGLSLALENHFHVYKRSQLLYRNSVSNNAVGTVYLGDGAWGTRTRKALDGQWYLAKSGSINHFWVLDINRSAIRYQAIDSAGRVFDRGRYDFSGNRESETELNH